MEDRPASSSDHGASFPGDPRPLLSFPAEGVAAVQSLANTRSGDDVLWKAALDYCLHGNLQAVLDEYAHMLVDWVEDRRREGSDRARTCSSAH